MLDDDIKGGANKYQTCAQIDQQQICVSIVEGDDKAGPEAQLKAEAGAAPGRHLHPQNLTMSKKLGK